MRILAFLLFPFAVLYGLITGVRNWLYDLRIIKSYPSPIRSVVVGNLSVGGTGKTPMVEFLIKGIGQKAKVGVLSRGYGRKTKGFLEADHHASPASIGDEPFQIYSKFGGAVPVFVGEDRVAAASKIHSVNPSLKAVILDDALQHRRFSGDLNLVLTTYEKPFFNDYMLPMGRLREYRNGAKRADALIITKCPIALSSNQKQEYTVKAEKYTKNGCPLLFSSIGYGVLEKLKEGVWDKKHVVSMTGLANDKPLLEHLRKEFNLLRSFSFGDHHDYKLEDLQKVISYLKTQSDSKPAIVTTEKDADKLKKLLKGDFLEDFPIFVQPIEATFSDEDKEVLLGLIAEKVI